MVPASWTRRNIRATRSSRLRFHLTFVPLPKIRVAAAYLIRATQYVALRSYNGHIMTVNELESLVETAVELQKEAIRHRAAAPGRMNVLDLVSASRLENYHSDAIAFLVHPRREHKHPEYGELFLDTLAENGLEVEGRQVVQVEREKQTESGRRIDLLIRTGKEVVIVENKIDAGDLAGQIRDYVEWCNRRFGSETIRLLYLTIDGHEMSEGSLPADQRGPLLEQVMRCSRRTGIRFYPGLRSLPHAFPERSRYGRRLRSIAMR